MAADTTVTEPPQAVTFAMEEPEIVVQSHAKENRRLPSLQDRPGVRDFAFSLRDWAVHVAEHLPFDTNGRRGIEAMCVGDATGLKENDYKCHARRGLAECMLGTPNVNSSTNVLLTLSW